LAVGTARAAELCIELAHVNPRLVVHLDVSTRRVGAGEVLSVEPARDLDEVRVSARVVAAAELGRLDRKPRARAIKVGTVLLRALRLARCHRRRRRYGRGSRRHGTVPRAPTTRSDAPAAVKPPLPIFRLPRHPLAQRLVPRGQHAQRGGPSAALGRIGRRIKPVAARADALLTRRPALGKVTRSGDRGDHQRAGREEQDLHLPPRAARRHCFAALLLCCAAAADTPDDVSAVAVAVALRVWARQKCQKARRGGDSWAALASTGTTPASHSSARPQP
jgi:hypothetical protein